MRAWLALGLASMPGSALAAPAHLGGAPESDVSFLRVFLALFFCLVLAALAIFLLRQRLGGGGAPAFFRRAGNVTARLKLVETRRIAPQSDLCLVECDGQDYLLLISPGGPLLIRERPAAGDGA